MSTAESVTPKPTAWPVLGWWRRVAEWWSDLPNPIVVKELRQAVRSWTALVMLIAYLVIQLVVVGVLLMAGGESVLAEQPMGDQVFLAAQIQLVITTVGFLPLYAGTRLFLERSDVNLDLMFITPLRPIWLVLGKLLAALVVGLLFFSASAPVMTMAYFLRGLDLVNAFILLGLDLVVMTFVVQLALFIAALPLPRSVTLIVGIGFALSLTWVVYLLCAVSYEMFFGFFRILSEPVSVILMAVTAVFLTVFFFTATHALLSPPSSNRLFIFKWTFLLTPMLYVGIGFVIVSNMVGWLSAGTAVWEWKKAFSVLAWVVSKVLTVMSWLAWCIAISERLQWGPRILAQVPRWRWLRVLVFPFYTGAANGLVFALLLTWLRWMALFAGYLAVKFLWNDLSAHDELPFVLERFRLEGWWSVDFLADGYLICYSLTAFWMRRYLEMQRGRLFPGWLLLALVVGLTSFASLVMAIVSSLMQLPEFSSVGLVFAPLPMLESFFDLYLLRGERVIVYLMASILIPVWLGIVALPTVRWWIRQVRLFHPPPRLAPEAEPRSRPLVAAAP